MNGTTTPRQKLSGVEESDIVDSKQSVHGGNACEASLDRQSFRRCKLHRAHGCGGNRSLGIAQAVGRRSKKKSRVRSRDGDIEQVNKKEKGGSEDTGSLRQRVLGRDSESPNRVIRWVCGEPDGQDGQVRDWK